MNELQIRKPYWTSCYLEVTEIDFMNGIVHGVIKDLKTDQIRDSNYSAPICGWEPVLSVEDVLSNV